jgi:hypothetical protein
VTLVELLIVTTVMGFLVATAGSSLVLAFRSFSGQGELEFKEIQGQRACMDLHYYLSNAVSFSISDNADLASVFGAADADSGTTLSLIQGDGSTVVFSFVPDVVKTTALSSITCAVGRLGIEVGGVSYIYCDDVFVPCAGSGGRPFSVSVTGGVNYHWGVPSGSFEFGVVNTVTGGTVTRPPLTMMGGTGSPLF